MQYVIGRAGASPPSRTAAIIFLYIYIFIYLFIYLYPYVRRALNLLRASFSPIFQYFSAVNVTPVSFSPIFQYFLTCMPYIIICAYSIWPWFRQPIDIVPSNRGLLLNQQRRERPIFSRLGARRIGESLLNQQRRERPVFSRLGARRIGESLLNQQRREKPVFSR